MEIGGADNTEYYEDSGGLQPLGDSDTTTLFRDLEHELEVMVKRYHVPPTDLEKIFQVVQTMFEMMDATKEAYEQLEEQKNELEELWKTEKDKRKSAQQHKLKLECRLDEERMRAESEKMALEKEKITLQTKLKETSEHKSNIEQEFHRLRDKTDRDEQMRRELMDQYKNHYESAKRSSLRRIASMRSSRYRRTTSSPEGQSIGAKVPSLPEQQTPDSIPESSGLEDSFPPSWTPESLVSDLSEVARLTSPPAVAKMSGNMSLEEELQQTKAVESRAQSESQLLEAQQVFLDGFDEPVLTHYQYRPQNGQLHPVHELNSEGSDSDEESTYPSWLMSRNSGDQSALSLAQELAAADPLFMPPSQGEMQVLAEVEVLQKEREVWEKERGRLEDEKGQLRQAKDGLESHNAQLQLELDLLRLSQKELQEELSDVRKERDDILGTYLDQPFDEYCITKKELHDLLKRHHKTAIELEKAKEEKLRLQGILDSKRTLFERFKARIKKLFSRYSPQTSAPSPPGHHHGVSPSPSSDTTLDSTTTPHRPSSLSPPLGPPSPLTRSVASVLTTGQFAAVRGWLLSQDSQVSVDALPSWIGQISLEGMETERIECAALGRVYFTPVEELPCDMTPPRPRALRRHSAYRSDLPVLQQTHAEVWVATCEESVAYIEIIDALAKPSKFRQRFVIKPRTRHIVCMKAIPGRIEVSNFTNSSCFSVNTSWMDSSNLTTPTQLPGQIQFHNIRPRSCPISRRPKCVSAYESPIREPEVLKAGLTASERLPQDSFLTTPEKAWPPRLRLTPPSPLLMKTDWTTNSEPGNLTSEATDQVRLRARRIHQGMLERGIIPEDPGPIPINGMESDPLEMECPDFSVNPLSPSMRASVRNERQRRMSSKDTVVMWMISEDNNLYLYPTTHPSHLPLNIVKLHSRALCIEYIGGKVFVGHTQSEISVYHRDEIADSWDTENPERISLPTYDPSENFDVKCIAGVGDKVWVGAGPSIFVLDGETLSREGSIFLDKWRKRPDQILSVGDVVVVATKGSSLFVFDAKSAQLVRKFDVFPSSQLLDQPQRVGSSKVPTDITAITADESTIYVGTSNGRMVAVPIENLCKTQHADLDVESSGGDGEVGEQPSIVVQGENDKTTGGVAVPGGNGGATVMVHETDKTFQKQTAVSLHTQKDSKVRSLIYIPLPVSKLLKPKDTAVLEQTVMYTSLPNLGSMYRLNISQPLHKSLLISVGRGHVKYTSDVECVEESSPLRERNESFQLLVWGHRNSLT